MFIAIINNKSMRSYDNGPRQWLSIVYSTYPDIINKYVDHVLNLPCSLTVTV